MIGVQSVHLIDALLQLIIDIGNYKVRSSHSQQRQHQTQLHQVRLSLANCTVVHLHPKTRENTQKAKKTKAD